MEFKCNVNVNLILKHNLFLSVIAYWYDRLI